MTASRWQAFDQNFEAFLRELLGTEGFHPWRIEAGLEMREAGGPVLFSVKITQYESVFVVSDTECADGIAERISERIEIAVNVDPSAIGDV